LYGIGLIILILTEKGMPVTIDRPFRRFKGHRKDSGVFVVIISINTSYFN